MSKLAITTGVIFITALSACDQIDSAAIQIKDQTGVDLTPYIEQIKQADRSKYMALGIPDEKTVSTAENKYYEALSEFLENQSIGARAGLSDTIVCLLYVSPPAAINAIIDMQKRIRDGETQFNTLFDASNELSRPIKITIMEMKNACGDTIQSESSDPEGT